MVVLLTADMARCLDFDSPRDEVSTNARVRPAARRPTDCRPRWAGVGHRLKCAPLRVAKSIHRCGILHRWAAGRCRSAPHTAQGHTIAFLYSALVSANRWWHAFEQ